MDTVQSLDMVESDIQEATNIAIALGILGLLIALGSGN